MPGILGRKIGMTRIFDEEGKVIVLTLVACEPNQITQVKTDKKDGYSAVVLGFEPLKKPKKTRKFRISREFPLEADTEAAIGDTITVEQFKEIEDVVVTSTSKGKGFQGVIKRHNFRRGPESHGSHHHREPGSIGACQLPGRVFKGKKMAGRMGGARVTLRKVPVVKIDAERNLIAIKGPVPGPNGGLVMIRA
jgi:large subunit ribosomal protein L3